MPTSMACRQTCGAATASTQGAQMTQQNDDRLARLGAAARTVLGYHRYAQSVPGNVYAIGQATAAVAVWGDLLGLDDPEQALAMARSAAEADQP